LQSYTDPCSPSGTGEVYALNYATATSVLGPTLATSTIPAAYFTTTTGVIKLQFVSNSSSSSGVELIAGDTKGEIPKIPANLTGTISTRLLNWLEVPTAE
jgi:hypothetical protein